jgi:exonuclease III
MGDIKLINWNVRGLNCAARREAVKILIQQAGPNIVCLQETKLDTVDSFLASEFLGPIYTSFEYLVADCTRGGILVAWDPRLVHAETPTRQRFSISLRITLKLSNTSFLLTSVYGPTDDGQKACFLNELTGCQPAWEQHGYAWGISI